MFRVAIFLILSVFSLQASLLDSYASVKAQVENRWQAFQADREFKEFKTGKSDAERKEEFENIHKGLPFSIEEIVYRLSLQRVNSVAKFGQYITLHRLAESYLKLYRARSS